MEVLRGPNDRPALIDDQTRKQQPPAWSQNSVSVDDEGLPFVEVKWSQLHATTGDLRQSTTATASRHTSSTNLPGQYT